MISKLSAKSHRLLLITLQGYREGRREMWHDLLPALPCSCLSQQLQFLTTVRLEPLCSTRSRKSSINPPSVFPPGAAVLAQAGMHLLRKARAAYWQWTPSLCPSLEGSPHGVAATASCLMSISGKLADGSPTAPEPKHQSPLLTLTSIVKGAASVCKEKRDKGLGHVFPRLSIQWLWSILGFGPKAH